MDSATTLNTGAEGMEDEKKIADNPTSVAAGLLGTCAQVGNKNPLGMSRRT
jgi:hypothetical protein